MIKEAIHQEDKMISNVYAPNNGSLKYKKQKTEKIERKCRLFNNYSSNFKTLAIDRASLWKINIKI